MADSNIKDTLYSLTNIVTRYKGTMQDYNGSLSKYLTTIIELVEAGCDKGVIIEHLRNIQKVTHEMSERDNGKNS